VPPPTLNAVIAAKASHTTAATAHETETATYDETGQELEPLPGLRVQRLREEHARGRGTIFSRYGDVPFQQVPDFPWKAPSGCKRQPLRPDWNTGGLPWMPATTNVVSTATTGWSPPG